jgi:hypothetical protein
MHVANVPPRHGRCKSAACWLRIRVERRSSLRMQESHSNAASIPRVSYSPPLHHLHCLTPILRRIFVIDRLATQYFLPRNHNLHPRIRSSSMSLADRQPLPNSAGIDRITRKANNRIGAVFSALYSFWIARQAAVDHNSPVAGGRRDAYSLIFFNHEPSTSSIENDFTSSPDELLAATLEFGIAGGTDFTSALDRTRELMTSHWSTERCGPLPRQRLIRFTIHRIHRRTPVVIFLSDGEDHVNDEAMYKICQGAARKGFVNHCSVMS